MRVLLLWCLNAVIFRYHRGDEVFPRPVLLQLQVIADITKRMGAGMAEFVSKDLGQGTVSTTEYNLYCHYVAGLVGEGLTRLFASTGIEGPQLLESLELANRCTSMLLDCPPDHAYSPRQHLGIASLFVRGLQIYFAMPYELEQHANPPFGGSGICLILRGKISREAYDTFRERLQTSQINQRVQKFETLRIDV